ncbi:hypothetical protein L1987_32593 [Smallanthus sonchifolius]|uniref:Uncharacterized protein n=1 Tax=Smallanthus sonchifolius TaxID=185202 RepID=A0ACB9HR95_9ASTR|nr:hypothetical protein L1987_32593 [Smallanthus sonchifolius]
MAFDAKSDQEYVFPSEASLGNKEFNTMEEMMMLQDLFRPGAGGDFKRSDLNILPKILQMITQTNGGGCHMEELLESTDEEEEEGNESGEEGDDMEGKGEPAGISQEFRPTAATTSLGLRHGG